MCPGTLPLKCKCLRIAPAQQGLALKALALPNLPMALLAQVDKQWGSTLALPPQTSNVASGSIWDMCCTPARKV